MNSVRVDRLHLWLLDGIYMSQLTTSPFSMRGKTCFSPFADKKNLGSHLSAAIMLLTKITTVQNELVLSYDRVLGLYFLAVIVEATIITLTLIFCDKETLFMCYFFPINLTRVS